MTLISVTTRSEITAVESLNLGPGATAERVTDAGLNTTQNKLGSASTPPVTKKAHFAQALTAGAATIDLTALTDAQGAAIASTGLRVQAIKVQNPNANQLAVTPAVSNGYGLTFTVPPQGEVLITSTDLLAEVAAGAKNLALAGTGTQSSNWMIIFG